MSNKLLLRQSEVNVQLAARRSKLRWLKRLSPERRHHATISHVEAEISALEAERDQIDVNVAATDTHKADVYGERFMPRSNSVRALVAAVEGMEQDHWTDEPLPCVGGIVLA